MVNSEKPESISSNKNTASDGNTQSKKNGRNHKLKKIDTNVRSFFLKKGREYYRNLFADIEISKSQFITLYLIYLSFASVLFIDIFLSFELGLGTDVFPYWGVVIGGLVLGFFIGGFLIDRVRGKRYPLLLFILTISCIITFLHVGFYFRQGEIVPVIMFLSNSFISGILFIFFLSFFIDFTTILERGRVFSFLNVMLGISVGALFLIVATDLFIFLPVLIIIGAIVYLYYNRESEEPYNPIILEHSQREINIQIAKYISFLAFFSIILGLIIRPSDIERLNFFRLGTFEIVSLVTITVLFSLITAILVGEIFDLYGRKASISYIILLISITNFVRLFEVNIQFFDIAIIYAGFLSSFMLVPLLLSDIAHREHLAKVFGISFSVNVLGIIGGIMIDISVIGIFTDKYTADIFLIGVIDFISIVCLFLLVNMKDSVSPKEQNWAENLLHLYVIHESGVLLYEHSFVEIDDLAESDLISGGFIGLVSILQEITKEEESLRVIDHGGKKILFGFTSNKSIIFVILITEELYVLRTKLTNFIKDIEEKYPIRIEDFDGVDTNLWKERIDPILEKHFKRKFFEFAHEFIEYEEFENKLRELKKL